MSIDRLDVPAATVTSDMAALIARQRQQLAADKLRWLLSPANRAPDGAAAEQRHLLYDADPDSTVPAFDYPQPGRAT